MMQPELDAVYRQTSYWVETPEFAAKLRIGEQAPEFDACLRPLGVTEWAIITACNPQSDPHPPKENRRRLRLLAARLLEAGYVTGHALGVGDAGDWYPEPSFCVLRIAAEIAAEIAREFQQHAIVIGKLGIAPELHFVLAPPGK
ncbi:MAG TPA: DUF3293 domain-containing protein [Planctomycetaceae bacterium]|nr:DUF3293 domain-containing protein [Planctomycetaceae bacterium]